ncbi:MAG: RodZ domain-containing protein [Pseudomonadota bacterium]
MELRGFDSYTVTLGDELRGERACRGWTLRDAARELCIKPEMIAAIENADLSAFPNRSVIPGYVRSYARYLGLDADEMYGRFCVEAGFESTLVSFGMTGAEGGAPRASEKATAVTGAVGADFTASRFAVRPAPRRIGASISLGGVVSAVSFSALFLALAYGGYTVLQDIQRVGFAPLPDAPAVVADAPVISGPIATAAAERPDPSVYGAGGALFGVETADRVVVERRDGPISSIDPANAGLIAGPALAQSPAVRHRAAPLMETRLAAAPVGERGEVAAEAPALPTIVESTVFAAAGPAPRQIVVTDRAWLRVRDESGAKLFEGILEPGEAFDLPAGVVATLRAGNAGDVFVAIDGQRYGPLGNPGSVVKNVSLRAEDVTARFTVADAPSGATAVTASR